jgi:Zn-dependent protease with chaperone function
MSLPAIYLDGRSAREHAVQIGISHGGITFQVAGSPCHWDMTRLELVDMTDGGTRLRLGHPDTPNARLLITDDGAVKALRQAAPEVFSHRRGGVRRDLRRLSIGVAGVGVGVLVVLAALPLIVTLLASLVPVSTERQFGQEAEESLTFFLPEVGRSCVDPRGQAVLERLTADLLGGLELDPEPSVRVVPHGLVNAFALPGGQIILFEGLVLKAKSPEEIAGVLAHEIGHVAHRHGVERVIRDSAIDALLSVLTSGSVGSAGGQLAGFLASQSYGRDAERQADRFAVERLNALDIRADGMIDFFDRAADGPRQGGGGRSLFSYLESHPGPEDRAASIRAGATGKRQVLDAREWTALRRICRTVETG